MKHYDQFIKDNWAVAGIYAIVHNVNNRLYLGEAENVGARIHKHLLSLFSDIHPVKPFQDDFNRYGVEAFSFKLVHEESDEPKRMAMEKELQLKQKKLLYSTFINGSLTKESPITSEQVAYIAELRKQGLSYSKIAEKANKLYGYNYTFGLYHWLLNHRK